MPNIGLYIYLVIFNSLVKFQTNEQSYPIIRKLYYLKKCKYI